MLTWTILPILTLLALVGILADEVNHPPNFGPALTEARQVRTDALYILMSEKRTK